IKHIHIRLFVQLVAHREPPPHGRPPPPRTTRPPPTKNFPRTVDARAVVRLRARLSRTHAFPPAPAARRAVRPVRPAVPAEATDESPLPAAREGRHPGARRIPLSAVPRHGPRDLHERDAGGRVPDDRGIAAGARAGAVAALGPQAAAEPAEAQPAAA